MTCAMWWSMTYFSACIICGKPCTPRVSAVCVVTSRMFAPGATACAVSTSRATSSAHALLSSWPGLLLLDGGALVAGEPWRWNCENVGMPGAHVTPSSPHIAGRPNAWSYTCRSCAMVSLPYESTTAMVMPRPSTPRSHSEARLYADAVDCGVKQRRPTDAHCAWVGGVSENDTCW